MAWTQVYDPFGVWWLSTLVAALPVVVLLGLLAIFRVKPHWAALAGAATAIIAASTAFHMPWALSSASFIFGAAFGLKIAWIVTAAVFLYNISVHTGQFEIMKESVAAITADRRLQALLVAFCFGALIEGAAGFGAPVAIAGAFMIGLGFKPMHAAILNLIANTAPVAWGSIGTPVHTLAAVTSLPEPELSAMIGRILPITALIVPFWLVRAMVGWRETFAVLPAILVVGVSFALTQFVWSNYVDSNLVDIASGAVSIVATLLFLRFWQPRRVYRFNEDGERDERTTGITGNTGRGEKGEAETGGRGDAGRGEKRDGAMGGRGEGEGLGDAETRGRWDPESGATNKAGSHTPGQIARAWMPFAMLTLFVLIWGLPATKNAMNRWTTPAFERGGWDVPLLHKAVTRAAPVVREPAPEPAKYDFNWLTATGTGCFFAAILAGIILGVAPRDLLKIFWKTLVRMRFAILAISLMLGLGYVTRYSGMDAVLGLAFTRTGLLFPFFGTLLGWLGVALTGSDTSSNALFGSLQRITAEQLGLSPILMCAANSAGGVMGKMIDAQSIVVATAATNQVGNEGAIFRAVMLHSIALASIVGLIVLAYAYL
ncbi:MAG TPA: L-lactate permease [Blastocatellia bacterium]|nr:L-lactate permease [Blastocatellia bacterium]